LVAKIPNVVWRGGVYHFRRAIPARFRSRLNRLELTCSLQTADYARAKFLSRALYLASEQLFLTLRTDAMLTDEQLRCIAQELYRQILIKRIHIGLRAAR
jgi:hypothetical protein